MSCSCTIVDEIKYFSVKICPFLILFYEIIKESEIMHIQNHHILILLVLTMTYCSIYKWHFKNYQAKIKSNLKHLNKRRALILSKPKLTPFFSAILFLSFFFLSTMHYLLCECKLHSNIYRVSWIKFYSPKKKLKSKLNNK